MATLLQKIQIDPQSSVPKHLQIRNAVAAVLRTQQLPAGAKLDSVREVADRIGVGSRTVARAYDLLRREGVIVIEPSYGAFVAAGSEVKTAVDVYLCAHPSYLERKHWLAFQRIQGVMAAAQRLGVQLHPLTGPGAVEADELCGRRCAVLVFDMAYRADGFGPIVDLARERHIPCCVVMGACDGMPGVEEHREMGFEQATEYLLGLGHRNIALINLAAHNGNAHGMTRAWQNRQGYLAALKRSGYPIRSELYVEALNPEDNEMYHTERALDSLLSLSPRPTAILCNNDVRALAVMKLLNARGLRIPEDMSVVGYDNRRECERANPRLTSVETQLVEQGEAALQFVLEQVWGREPKPPAVFPRLVRRDSVAAVGGAGLV